VLFFFGVLTFRGAPDVGANLPTPWLGVWERINVLGFMVWQAVLAIVLMWSGPGASAHRAVKASDGAWTSGLSPR
jgi:hypothetical protein